MKEPITSCRPLWLAAVSIQLLFSPFRQLSLLPVLIWASTIRVSFTFLRLQLWSPDAYWLLSVLCWNTLWACHLKMHWTRVLRKVTPPLGHISVTPTEKFGPMLSVSFVCMQYHLLASQDSFSMRRTFSSLLRTALGCQYSWSACITSVMQWDVSCRRLFAADLRRKSFESWLCVGCFWSLPRY